MLYRVILSLGSNYNEQQNMAFAVEQLKKTIPVYPLFRKLLYRAGGQLLQHWQLP